jgi:predicted site-specific integrase-resolvase
MADRTDKDPDDLLLTPKDLAEYLKVSEATVRRWRQEKRGPRVTWISARRARYRWRDVQSWLARSGRKPGSAGGAS